jgi:hypothetical protein
MCPYTTCGQMVIQLWGQQQVIWQSALIQVVLYLYKTEIVQAKHNLAILKVQVMGCLAIQEVPVRFDWRPHPSGKCNWIIPPTRFCVHTNRIQLP